MWGVLFQGDVQLTVLAELGAGGAEELVLGDVGGFEGVLAVFAC